MCYFDDFLEGDHVDFTSNDNVCTRCNTAVADMEFHGTFVGHRLIDGVIKAVIKMDEPQPQCQVCGMTILRFLAPCEEEGPNLSAYENVILPITTLQPDYVDL